MGTVRWLMTSIFLGVAAICLAPLLGSTRSSQPLARDASAAASDDDFDEALAARKALAEVLREQQGVDGRSAGAARQEIAEGETEIPRFQVEAYCSTHKECIAVEQQAYDSLKVEWAELTEDERQKIIRISSSYPSMKYSVAESRARNFIQIRESHTPTPTFRY